MLLCHLWVAENRLLSIHLILNVLSIVKSNIILVPSMVSFAAQRVFIISREFVSLFYKLV